MWYRYTWIRVKHHEQETAIETGLPFPSPTLVGCAIAVDRAYFMKLGAFDEGMRIWGGENIELGFRTWMCGGQVKTVICSRVGHVFKVCHVLSFAQLCSQGGAQSKNLGALTFFPLPFPSSILPPFPPVVSYPTRSRPFSFLSFSPFIPYLFSSPPFHTAVRRLRLPTVVKIDNL